MRYLTALGLALAVGVITAFMGGWLVALAVDVLLRLLGRDPLTGSELYRVYIAVGTAAAIFIFRRTMRDGVE